MADRGTYQELKSSVLAGGVTKELLDKIMRSLRDPFFALTWKKTNTGSFTRVLAANTNADLLDNAAITEVDASFTGEYRHFFQHTTTPDGSVTYESTDPALTDQNGTAGKAANSDEPEMRLLCGCSIEYETDTNGRLLLSLAKNAEGFNWDNRTREKAVASSEINTLSFNNGSFWFVPDDKIRLAVRPSVGMTLTVYRVDLWGRMVFT